MNRVSIRLVAAAALCGALALGVPAAAPGGAASQGGPGEAAPAAAKGKKQGCKKKGKAGKKGKKRRCAKPPAAVVPPQAPPPTPAALSIAPAAYDFGFVDALFTPRHEREFTVTNGGGSPSGALAIALGGDDPEDYEINDDGCSGAPLGSGASCTFDVAFVPPPTGEFDCDATVTVTGTPGGAVTGTVTADGFV